jgi:hypothetical protein
MLLLLLVAVALLALLLTDGLPGRWALLPAAAMCCCSMLPASDWPLEGLALPAPLSAMYAAASCSKVTPPVRSVLTCGGASRIRSCWLPACWLPATQFQPLPLCCCWQKPPSGTCYWAAEDQPLARTSRNRSWNLASDPSPSLALGGNLRKSAHLQVGAGAQQGPLLARTA